MTAQNVKTVDAAPGKAEAAEDVAATMAAMGRRARAAMHVLANTPTEKKNAALIAMAAALRRAEPAIIPSLSRARGGAVWQLVGLITRRS